MNPFERVNEPFATRSEAKAVSVHIRVRGHIHGKSEANLSRNLSTGTPPKFFSAILCFVALVYNYIFFRTAVLRKLFDIRFSYKHCNFSQVRLLVKMASKTMRGSICKINYFLFSHVLWSHAICLRLLDCRRIIACLLANWQGAFSLFKRKNWKTTERPCEFKDNKFDKLT